MISNCPHCKKEIKFKEAQKVKLKAAMAKLKPGQTMKFGCPSCKKPIELGANSAKQQEAKPAAPKAKATPPAEAPKQAEAPKKVKEKPKPVNPPPDPPKAPDISWLTDGKMEEKGDIIQDVPTAMILMPESAERDIVAETYNDLKFQLFYPGTVDEAIDNMRFKDYAAIVYHMTYEGVPLHESQFHAHLTHVSMNKRRYTFYTLIGPDFRTLYDLEALAYSANLVVNEKEMPHFRILLKKGKADYDALFGPFIAMLKAHSKK